MAGDVARWVEAERKAYKAHESRYGEWCADIAFGFPDGDTMLPTGCQHDICMTDEGTNGPCQLGDDE